MRAGLFRFCSLVCLLISVLLLGKIISFSDEFVAGTDYKYTMERIEDEKDFLINIRGYSKSEAEMILDIYENKGISAFQMKDLLNMKIKYYSSEYEEGIRSSDLSSLWWYVTILLYLTIGVFILEFILHFLGTVNIGAPLVVILLPWFHVAYHITDNEIIGTRSDLNVSPRLLVAMIFITISCLLWYQGNRCLDEESRYGIMDLIKGRKKLWFRRVFSKEYSEETVPTKICDRCKAENNLKAAYCRKCGLEFIASDIEPKDYKSPFVTPDEGFSKESEAERGDSKKKTGIKISKDKKFGDIKDAGKEEKILELFMIYDNRDFERRNTEYMVTCPGCNMENAKGKKRCVLCGKML